MYDVYYRTRAQHEIQIRAFQGQHSEAEQRQVWTNHTRTQREVLASTVLEVGNIHVREIGLGWKADEKYSSLQLLHFLQLMYYLTLSGGAEFFSARVEKPNISMSVCTTAPLFPLSCSSLSRGCICDDLFIKLGWVGLVFQLWDVCSWLKYTEVVSMNFGGQSDPYVAEKHVQSLSLHVFA